MFNLNLFLFVYIFSLFGSVMLLFKPYDYLTTYNRLTLLELTIKILLSIIPAFNTIVFIILFYDFIKMEYYFYKD